MVTTSDKLLLRIPEVVEILGISLSKVYALINDGTLPTVHVGKSVRVPSSGLKQWVQTLTDRAEVAA